MLEVVTLAPQHPRWPGQLVLRLGKAAPERLYALGDLSILHGQRTALFCSTRCPGEAILQALAAARRLRDEGVTVISGFHSPVERECLRILLRGTQPVILCPARGLEGMRLAADWKGALEAGRLLLLSPFADGPRRVTRQSAQRRNALVAALANRALVVHAAPGGQVAQVVEWLEGWGVEME